jgi:hypothetical protein
MFMEFSTDFLLNKYLNCSVWGLAVRYIVRRQRVNKDLEGDFVI